MGSPEIRNIIDFIGNRENVPKVGVPQTSSPRKNLRDGAKGDITEIILEIQYFSSPAARHNVTFE